MGCKINFIFNNKNHDELMKNKEQLVMIADEVVMSKIYFIRDLKVILDSDLADLYQVEIKVLNQAVKRNIERFPENFRFQLTNEEYESTLRSQNVTLKRGQHPKYLPYAFTEHGILMLASVLNSERADRVRMIIIETFIKLREILFLNKDILHQLEKVQGKLAEHDNQLIAILEYIRQIEQLKQTETDFKNRLRIGFRSDQ